MKPVYTVPFERYELRISKEDRTCWTWQERDGAEESQCTRMIGRGETYMVSTIFPGHDSGFADEGYRMKIVWDANNQIKWVRETVPAAPVSSPFCLPCCNRWDNITRALAWITEQRGASAA